MINDYILDTGSSSCSKASEGPNPKPIDLDFNTDKIDLSFFLLDLFLLLLEFCSRMSMIISLLELRLF